MEAGSKRTANANSIAKHKITRSKHIKKAAFILRGKSAKYFKIKLGDTIFNGAMFDKEPVFFRIASDYVILSTKLLGVFLRTALGSNLYYFCHKGI